MLRAIPDNPRQLVWTFKDLLTTRLWIITWRRAAYPCASVATGLAALRWSIRTRFMWNNGSLWCAAQHTSASARALRIDNCFGPELSSDAPPDFGVRASGHAALHLDQGPEGLASLISRPFITPIASRARGQCGGRFNHRARQTGHSTAQAAHWNLPDTAAVLGKCEVPLLGE